MKPFETLAVEPTPGGGELALRRRDADYYILLDGEELMSTRVHGSERALAEMTCAPLASCECPRILIGGLGLGYTLRAALELLPRSAEVEVAEIFPCVVEWHRTHLRHLGQEIDDRRVRIVQEDVADVLADRRRSPYDAILLDVDNGPDAWCLESNGRIYGRSGLEHIRRALAPDGVLAIWSSSPDPAFVKRLGRNGFDARSETVRSRGKKGYRHTIFFARDRR